MLQSEALVLVAECEDKRLLTASEHIVGGRLGAPTGFMMRPLWCQRVQVPTAPTASPFITKACIRWLFSTSRQ